MERLNEILPPHIRVSKLRLSYVEELFPDLKDSPYIVIHKNIPCTQLSPSYEKKERSFDEYSAKHDISGSPLEYSFGNYEFDDTVLIVRQNWQKEEELYLPLNRIDACNTLNLCLEYLDDNSLPILALCDGKDARQSRIIGSIVCKNWFTTLEVISTGMTTPATIKNERNGILQEHLKKSFIQKHDIKISTYNMFELFGTKQERIDWKRTSKSDFEGSISIETDSSNLILHPRLSKNILVAQINAGWKHSPLKELRCQLHLLIQYLSIIDESKKDIGLQDPVKFITPYVEEQNIITEKLNLLLNGELSFREFENVNKITSMNKEKCKNSEIDAKLLGHVQTVSLRHDIDFTDLLWEILIKSSEYPQMITCIETVLKEILEHKFVPQVNDTNSTRFIKRISDLHQQETMSHLLVGSVPLKLVADMGFEKLARDYLYILRGARLIDLYDIRQKLADVSSGIFNIEDYRKKLIILAQLHISLECMLLIETHLECPIENLQSLFAYCYKEFVSKNSPLQNYTELCSHIYTLTAPLPNAIADELNKMDPTIWRASLSSHTAALKLTTTTYYSKMPIFPTDIYPTEDINAQEEIIYGISATSSSMKYKKL